MEMPGATRIVVLYSIFAAISTAANIGSQALMIFLYSGIYAVEASILVGTLVGLPIKYLLEKKYIFVFKADNLAHDGRLFFLYSVMGVWTTVIFWGVEYAFHLLFGTDSMRYLGGILGLTIGYVIKYRLDKKYVFVTRPGLLMGIS